MINQQRNSCNELEFYQFIETFSNAEIFEFLKDIFETEKYNEKFKEIIKEYDESKINLNNLKKCFCSYIFNISTGIVIAGFNKEDMFPSYVSFNIIANVNNMLLYQDMDTKLNYSGTLLKEESERNLLKTMAEFKEVVLDAGITREPYKVTTYIRKLATRINDFYTVCRVLDPANAELTSQRLALVKAAEITLKNALTLIGVTAPNYMKTKTEEK